MEVMLAFLAEGSPLVSKLAGLLGMVTVCAISEEQFGSEMLDVCNF